MLFFPVEFKHCFFKLGTTLDGTSDREDIVAHQNQVVASFSDTSESKAELSEKLYNIFTVVPVSFSSKLDSTVPGVMKRQSNKLIVVVQDFNNCIAM